ncbi:MAG: glycosyltransferase family 2 protein [Candidatus Roizmanbacteria bacterium]|nr:glycosyltransferase family 2 protein [Candidatus Roizmanbacteria bacterium]
MARIAVITVTYNTPKADIIRLKKETKCLSPQAFIVIDNTHNHNGFAKGVNEGICQALSLKPKPDQLLIMNPDIHFTKLSQKSVQEVCSAYDIWGGVIQQHGKTYYKGVIDPNNLSGGLSQTPPATNPYPVDFVSGSCMGIRASIVPRVGLLNETYHMYYEDVEWCYRATKKGCTVGATTSITYDHFENSTKYPKKDYYLTRNRLLFLWQHGSLWQKIHELLTIPKHIKKLL